MLIAIVLSLIILPSQVLALGLGVAPAKLDFIVRPGGNEMKTLHVINQSNQESIFRVYVEGEYEEWFLINPGEFMLASQQSRGVEIVVAPPFTASDEHDLSICVVSLPPDSNLGIGAGVKVPTNIQVLAFPIALILGGGVAVVLLLLLAGIQIWRRHKTRHAFT